MSERQVSGLLGRVASHTPPLDVDLAGVVAVGRRRVRRRRVVVGSAATAALAGVLWFGPGPGFPEAGEISPASVSWEVEEETTLDLLEAESSERDRWSQSAPEELAALTVAKSPRGSSVTYVVDGEEHTVEGETMAGGADLFVGEEATVVLWRPPPEAEGDVRLVPLEPVSETSSTVRGTIEIDGADLSYWVTLGTSNYRPEDLVFHNGRQVWTASGQVATTVELRDGDAEATGFELSELGMTGIVNDEFLGVAWTMRTEDYTVERLPNEAVFARQVQLRQTQVGQEREVVDVGPAVPTVELPSADLVLFDREGDFPDVQWSTDAITWHDQENGGDPAETTVQPGPVAPGGMVRLLDETFVVGLDQQDWPELRKDDGTVFLSVSDESGVIGDSGTVSWREGWWPWAPRNTVHFAVGEEDPPAPDGGGEVQDLVTISGPSGKVTLGVVPAQG